MAGKIYKLFKMKNLISIWIIAGLALFACDEEPIGQQPTDGASPGPVSNVTSRNTPGGAVLKYTLPDDEDLLYVKAVFSLKEGVMSESRASLYVDTLKIEGFGDTQPREVNLIAVDRSRNESAPVTVTVSPLEPFVAGIGRTLGLIPDFGGVQAYWKNPSKAEISVVVLKKDNNNEYVPLETFYSAMADGQGVVRGMDTISGDFGVFVQDRWVNKSEILYYTLTPIYETLFDRLKFRAVDLPGDAPVGAGWNKDRMWDDVIGENGFSSQGGLGTMPHSVTIDMGVTGRLSRLRLFQRTGNSNDYVFAEGNPKTFEVWGCENLDASGNWDSWTRLMDCQSVKPSGLPLGTNSNEDIARAIEGEDFVCPPTNPRVRYLRIRVSKTWAGGDNIQIGEIRIYGDNR